MLIHQLVGIILDLKQPQPPIRGETILLQHAIGTPRLTDLLPCLLQLPSSHLWLRAEFHLTDHKVSTCQLYYKNQKKNRDLCSVIDFESVGDIDSARPSQYRLWWRRTGKPRDKQAVKHPDSGSDSRQRWLLQIIPTTSIKATVSTSQRIWQNKHYTS